MTNTSRTLKALRDQGMVCGVVERWIPQARKRIDLFSIIDIIALDPSENQVVGVQSCGQAFSEHYKKITEEYADNTRLWLQMQGTAFELWSWRKLKAKRGGKLMLWTPRVREIRLEDLE